MKTILVTLTAITCAYAAEMSQEDMEAGRTPATAHICTLNTPSAASEDDDIRTVGDTMTAPTTYVQATPTFEVSWPPMNAVPIGAAPERPRRNQVAPEPRPYKSFSNFTREMDGRFTAIASTQFPERSMSLPVIDGRDWNTFERYFVQRGYEVMEHYNLSINPFSRMVTAFINIEQKCLLKAKVETMNFIEKDMKTLKWHSKEKERGDLFREIRCQKINDAYLEQTNCIRTKNFEGSAALTIEEWVFINRQLLLRHDFLIKSSLMPD